LLLSNYQSENIMLQALPSAVVTNIIVNYTNGNQFNSCERALSIIRSKSIGNDLLNEIQSLGAEGKQIRIIIDNAGVNNSKSVLSPKQAIEWNASPDENDLVNNHIAEQLSSKMTYPVGGSREAGTNVQITWNNRISGNVRNGIPTNDYQRVNNYIPLSHLLIHALHIMKSDVLTDSHEEQARTGVKRAAEERRTIGIGEFQFEKYSENNIRREHELEPRIK